MKTFAIVASTALIASTASATFVNLSVERTTVGNRSVYSIWANFSASNDRIVNAFDFTTVTGTMSAVHNDNAFGDVDTDGDGYADVFGATGAWSQTWNNTAGIPSDSFVMIGAPGPVALDPGFTGPFVSNTIANGSGWYDSTPGSQNQPGASLRLKIMQIARLTSQEAIYTANVTVGYAAFGTTTAQFGNGTFTIPAPGALALLSLAGFSSRRRK